jgi:hypothetical protein
MYLNFSEDHAALRDLRNRVVKPETRKVTQLLGLDVRYVVPFFQQSCEAVEVR